MKVNLKVRIKNPWFWVGLLSVILTAMGVDPESLTSWKAVLDMLVTFVGNPFIVFTTALAILGVFIDPTTSGAGDSKQALTYTSPKKDTEG